MQTAYVACITGRFFVNYSIILYLCNLKIYPLK